MAKLIKSHKLKGGNFQQENARLTSVYKSKTENLTIIEVHDLNHDTERIILKLETHEMTNIIASQNTKDYRFVRIPLHKLDEIMKIIAREE